MSYEIREFEIGEQDDNCIWKFKLGNPNVSRIDFFSEEQSLRSLFHLSQDFLNQIEANINRKKKKIPPKDRVIRKLCEKMLKTLRISLKIFSHDIQERIEHVTAYFQKTELPQDVRARIQTKSQKWILEAWVRPFRGFR